jgi:hypothetical protein
MILKGGRVVSMLRTFDEIIEAAIKNSLAYIPVYLEEKRHRKYAYKKNLKSRRGKK